MQMKDVTHVFVLSPEIQTRRIVQSWSVMVAAAVTVELAAMQASAVQSLALMPIRTTFAMTSMRFAMWTTSHCVAGRYHHNVKMEKYHRLLTDVMPTANASPGPIVSPKKCLATYAVAF